MRGYKFDWIDPWEVGEQAREQVQLAHALTTLAQESREAADKVLEKSRTSSAARVRFVFKPADSTL